MGRAVGPVGRAAVCARARARERRWVGGWVGEWVGARAVARVGPVPNTSHCVGRAAGPVGRAAAATGGVGSLRAAWPPPAGWVGERMRMCSTAAEFLQVEPKRSG